MLKFSGKSRISEYQYFRFASNSQTLRVITMKQVKVFTRVLNVQQVVQPRGNYIITYNVSGKYAIIIVRQKYNCNLRYTCRWYRSTNGAVRSKYLAFLAYFTK